MCSSKVRYTFSSTIEPAARSELGDIMTDRMMFFRQRQEQKGLVEIRIWVSKEDEDFFKYLAKQSRPHKGSC
jgi:hypothetical protein